ncbi:MAG: ABC transporter transmembrane domain-containing protein, partial [Betaproteobacteria bacterium]
MRRSSRSSSDYRPTHDTTTNESRIWLTLKKLAPYLWQYRLRVLLALSCLIAAKLANVAVPLIFKEMIDSLTSSQLPIVLPILLLTLYGALRFSTSLFTELREILFARVTQHIVRRIALEVFRHLHSLSLRFHL